MLNNKIIIAFIIVIAISLGVCVITRAEEIPGGNYEWSDSDVSESTPTDEKSATEGIDTSDVHSTEMTKKSPEEVDTDTGINPFDKVYAAFMQNAEKILSALTLIGSLLLAYAYRRGLLPILKGGLGALRDTAEDIKTAQSEAGNLTRELNENLKERLTALEKSVYDLAMGVDKMSVELEHTTELDKERERMKRIAEAQVDMLYNVFMNSSLPEYQKAELSDRIAKMRGELDG